MVYFCVYFPLIHVSIEFARYFCEIKYKIFFLGNFKHVMIYLRIQYPPPLFSASFPIATMTDS